MRITETFFIAIGLAMDAFAVSVCKGLSMSKMNWKKSFIIALYFGLFQMVMPIIGFWISSGLSEWIEAVNHWIVFVLLSFIGMKMIRESFEKEISLNDRVDFKTMWMLGVATSIDALAVGITYAFLDAKNIILSFFLIGIITFIISLFGVKVGNIFGDKYGNKAEFIGGIILIFSGIKILLEHTILT